MVPGVNKLFTALERTGIKEFGYSNDIIMVSIGSILYKDVCGEDASSGDRVNENE